MTAMQFDVQKKETRAPERAERESQSSGGGAFMGAGLAVFLVATAFFSGFHFGSDTRVEAGLGSLFKRPASEPVNGVNLDQFWEVWRLLEQKYVSGTTTDTLTNEERLQGAIDGLVASYGDPYTVYLPPAEAASFEEDISGNFGGVGMEVGMRDGVITIIAPLPNTPAERGGLVAGDRIVRIDGESTERMSIDAAVKRIRGESGTNVVLTIYREGDPEVREVTLTRAIIDIPTIDTEVVDGVFIISLYNFNAISEMKMQEALREFVRSGADKLIVDVRGNPGGFLQSAVSISSYFLPVGKVVVEENFGNSSRDDVVYRSTGKTFRTFTPDSLVILIDRGSASASEILAGALRAHGVATLIGDRTFGKGSVQELVELNGGASLKVTVARWLTPDGVSISDGGLAPDITVARTPEMILADEDPQRQAAIDFLRGRYVAPATTTPAQ
jgi:carboxyl-terminal processing protease